ncbi:hypothetical protein QYF61_022021 [Mycteria americana]|uniref:Uncharacterized protein n=1 Tax=Mycteria americana TaxID=33587 RepID=A0AAN7RRT5_MYCAM|nr:hypothetical protein QYF61_022021 [Mycteria americana]
MHRPNAGGQEHSNGILVIPTAMHGALQAETSYNQYDEFLESDRQRTDRPQLEKEATRYQNKATFEEHCRKREVQAYLFFTILKGDVYYKSARISQNGIEDEITESQNRIGWKRPLRSSSPTINLTLPRPPLHHVPKLLIQMSFKYLQGWRLNHFPGQPVPMLDNPLGEEKFPNIQAKPPLVQLEAISSCPITCYLGEETDPHLSTTSFQVVVESEKVSPQPPFLQAKQSPLPQPLLIRLLLQTLHQLHCPSLDTLQHLNVFLVVRGPKLNTVFEVWPHQCRVQGHDHFPSPAGHTIFDTSQDAVGFLGHLGTLLAHIQAAVNQHAQVLLCQAAFQPLFPKPVALHGVAVAQVQDLALGLVKLHTADLSPSIQPVQVLLQSLPPLKQINTPAQLGVICKLTEGALNPFVQIIDKDVKQNWPQHRALGNTACDRPPTGVNSIHHHSLGPAIQPVLYPAKSTPVQAMSSQFLQENAVGNRVKGFAEVKIDNIHSGFPSSTRWVTLS